MISRAVAAQEPLTHRVDPVHPYGRTTVARAADTLFGELCRLTIGVRSTKGFKKTRLDDKKVIFGPLESGRNAQ